MYDKPLPPFSDSDPVADKLIAELLETVRPNHHVPTYDDRVKLLIKEAKARLLAEGARVLNVHVAAVSAYEYSIHVKTVDLRLHHAFNTFTIDYDQGISAVCDSLISLYRNKDQSKAKYVYRYGVPEKEEQDHA